MDRLPRDIEKFVSNQNYKRNQIGMSDAQVRMYDDYVLKIQPQSGETDNAANMSKFLEHQLHIPKVLKYIVDDHFAYTLMTKVEGEMLCERKYMEDSEYVISMVAQGLKQLWAVDIRNCPYDYSRISNRLKIAEQNVCQERVDVADAEPETFGKGGFKNPKALLEWLKSNTPKEDIVLTHGDFCLPNILTKNWQISGYIDIGKMGPADRWQDIAIAIRSLKHNFDGRYFDGEKLFDFKPQMLLDQLDIVFDAKKYKYYLLLDELF